MRSTIIFFALTATVIAATSCGNSKNVNTEVPSTEASSKKKIEKTEETTLFKNYETIENKMNRASELKIINPAPEMPGQ